MYVCMSPSMLADVGPADNQKSRARAFSHSPVKCAHTHTRTRMNCMHTRATYVYICGDVQDMSISRHAHEDAHTRTRYKSTHVATHR